jgi:hypothetical protein
MSDFSDNVATSNRARRPKEIVKAITDTGSASRHRLNLSEMIIAWQHHNEESTDQHKEDVYFTFYIINEALKEIGKLERRVE